MLQALINVILPVFAVIGGGFAATRAGLMTETNADAVMKFAQGIAIPCLLFLAIATADLGQTFDLALLISFYSGSLVAFVTGICGARFLFGRDWPDSVVIGFCGLFANSVLLGLPITEAAYGSDGLAGNYAIIALHAPFCYGIGITVMEFVRNAGKPGGAFVTAVFKAMFRNALIMAIGLGFVFNLTGLGLPGFLDKALRMIGEAALPCALFALGGILARYRPEGDLRIMAFMVVISLVLHPFVTWNVGSGFDLPQEFFQSAVLTAAMAPGVNAYIFADMYGRGKRVVASTVLIATLVSILTVWGWLTALSL